MVAYSLHVSFCAGSNEHRFISQISLVFKWSKLKSLGLLESERLYESYTNLHLPFIFGLDLSVILTGALATYLANYIQKHLWIAYIGLGFILIVAIQLIIGGMVDLEILKINDQFLKYF